MLVMSPHDLEIVNMLKARDILEDVEEGCLNHANGGIVFGCPDCDQFDDVYCQHAEYCRAHRTEPRIHPLTEHGGAAMLNPFSKLGVPGTELIRFVATNLPLDGTMPSNSCIQHMRSIFRLWDLYQAHKMKGIESVVLYTHGPCGAAQAVNLPIEQLLMDQVLGHHRVQRLFEGEQLQVVSFVHLCYPDGRKKTKRLHIRKFQELMADEQGQLIIHT